jgi:hypothetical protein
MSLPVMEITLVKAAWPGDRDRAWLKVGGVARCGPIHVIYDLPHLAVESLFGITAGCGQTGCQVPRGSGPGGNGSRPKRQKQGRIVSGVAAGVPAGQWLTHGHRRAKAITNCVVNRWGDGPDTPRGVRDRAARQHDPSLADLLVQVDDGTIAMAIRGCRDLERRWLEVPPGGRLRLSWPLAPDFFAVATRSPATDNDQG